MTALGKPPSIRIQYRREYRDRTRRIRNSYWVVVCFWASAERKLAKIGGIQNWYNQRRGVGGVFATAHGISGSVSPEKTWAKLSRLIRHFTNTGMCMN